MTIDVLKTLRAAEAALGDNLVWITDKCDLEVRQQDVETLRRLDQLESAWKDCVRTITGLGHKL